MATPSEKFAIKITERSFLRLWSFLSPRRSDKKEVCDVLVVTENYILIISVKEKALSNKLSPEVAEERWTREAIKQSISQVFGAEKYIKSGKLVTTNDLKHTIHIPNNAAIFRIALAMGDNGLCARRTGTYEKGFVHVFAPDDFEIVLNELNTISDFCRYLRDKEKVQSTKSKFISAHSERDMFAYYLLNGRKFTKNHNSVFIGHGMFEELLRNKKYLDKKEEDQVSQLWDSVICEYADSFFGGTLAGIDSLANAQKALGRMALEDRFSRRFLSSAWLDFMQSTTDPMRRSRTTQSDSTKTSYVFFAYPKGAERAIRVEELKMRCLLARKKFPQNKVVVGIALEAFSSSVNITYDFIYLEQDEWTETDDSYVRDAEQKMKTSVQMRHIDLYEYPITRVILPNQICPCGSGKKYKKCCMQ